MSRGFIKLHRQIQDHWIWEKPDKAHAWLDLIMMAAWRPQTRPVGGKRLVIPRGGIVASERFLSGRWKWSTTRVRNFMRNLALDSMISTEKKQGVTVVTLSNYEDYNPVDREEKAVKKRERSAEEADAKQRESKEKKVKKEEEREDVVEVRPALATTTTTTAASGLEASVEKLFVAAGIKTPVTSLTSMQFTEFGNLPCLRDPEQVEAICRYLPKHLANRNSKLPYNVGFLIRDLSEHLLENALKPENHTMKRNSRIVKGNGGVYF